MPCDGGQYSNTTGAWTCNQCPIGSYVASPVGAYGASVCALCAAGTYSGAAGQLSCTQCAIGSAQSQLGSSACVRCSAGQYASSPGAPSCSAALPGNYVPGPGAFQQLSCAAGSYQLNTGQTACNLCPAGSAQTLPGQTSCVTCTAGTYSSSPGTVQCASCAPGTVAPLANSTSCTSCLPGSSQGNIGQPACSSCAVGRAQSLSSSIDCVDCNAGPKRTVHTALVSACYLPAHLIFVSVASLSRHFCQHDGQRRMHFLSGRLHIAGCCIYMQRMCSWNIHRHQWFRRMQPLLTRQSQGRAASGMSKGAEMCSRVVWIVTVIFCACSCRVRLPMGLALLCVLCAALASSRRAPPAGATVICALQALRSRSWDQSLAQRVVQDTTPPLRGFHNACRAGWGTDTAACMARASGD